MSQDDHTPTTAANGDKEDILREMYEQLQTLDSRVSELEDENRELRETNEELTNDVTTFKKKITVLEDENSTLRTKLTPLETTVDELEGLIHAASSRTDAIYEEVEQAQEDITEESFRSQERVAELTKRVAGIENELGLEDWETASSLAPNACALERFASMPTDRRDDELKAPVVRATLVWENFDDWSSPTHKGRVIRSGELRKLLKAQTGDKLAWTQVYRVMEEFADNTTAQYTYLGENDETSSVGKALIRLRNPVQDGEKAVTDGGY